MRIAPEGLRPFQGFHLGYFLGGALGFASVYYCCSQLDCFTGIHKKKYHKTDRTASRPRQGLQDAFDDEILSEQFTRNIQFFGSQGQQQVHDSFVVVVGLGVRISTSFSTRFLKL